MSELRHDPIQRRWVIIAAERRARPHEYLIQSSTIDNETICPFCPGYEEQTPPEIYRIQNNGRIKNGSPWLIRVVPNRYPALQVEPSEMGRHANGLYDVMNGIGAHEVIIETPQHDMTISDMSVDHLADIFKIYRNRLNDLMADNRLRYVLIFKNHGASAGASLSHSHSQIIATPVTPHTVAIELKSTHEHYQIKERCLICDIIQQEVSVGDRVIYDDGAFITFAPYASRFPFELMIAPRVHSHNFGSITDSDITLLAECLRDNLRRMKILLNDPSFNFVIHTSPNVHGSPRRAGYWVSLEYDYHWHIEIFPRLTRVAGFEWGTGFYINSTPPEEAAKFMREVNLNAK